MTPEILTAISTIILALVAVVVTLRDFIISILLRPHLMCLPSAYCHLVPLQTINTQTGSIKLESKVHYCRLEIYNEGNVSAKDVEVIVTEVRKKHNYKYFKRMPIGTPYNLTWTHKMDSPYLSVLSPGTKRHITLGHILEPNQRQNYPAENPRFTYDLKKTLFHLDFFTKSTTREYLLPHDEYQVDIQIVASNLKKPAEYTVKLNLTGEWFESEQEMYAKGIVITIS